jgi:hypothetical protein
MPARPSADSHRARWLSLPLLLVLLLSVGLVALPGCRGCWSDTTTAEAKKKKEEEEKKKKRKKAEKPKPDFEPLHVRMLPSNDPTPTDRNPRVMVKPGHWIAVNEVTKANNFDFPGEMTTFCEVPGSSLPLEVENTSARLSIWRPAILPKGQFKTFESLFYVPRRAGALGSTYSLRSELRGARGGRVEEFTTVASRSLKPYEHFIVVLAANTAAYSHLDKLNSVRMPELETVAPDDMAMADTLRHYYVVRPNVERRVPLPSYPLAWTTIAYVVWDDVNPAVLTEEQQQALLDWIHWGGQLILSGPSSLDKLKGTFLAPYLPGEVDQTVRLDQTAFDELNRTFSLKRDPAKVAQEGTQAKGVALRTIEISAERPMVAVELKAHPQARSVDGTGGLVVERRIGGGRIVVTRFPLTDVRIRQWRNFDGFFNAALLRRPAREFSNNSSYATSSFTMNWAERHFFGMLQEARLGSTLRYFSRDVGFLPDDRNRPAVAATPNAAEVETSEAMADMGMGAASPAGSMMMSPYDAGQTRRWPDTSSAHPDVDDWRFAGYHASPQSGVAAWDDNGAASTAAKQALTEAAGIEIPRADFVIKVLAVYLIVLVPLNWLVFAVLGRVEWAWVAAPLIAVVGAGAVIRLAQLDIGFARSRTEIAVLEAQGDYDRAHLTRYTALYTSLSSSYTVAFEDHSALALPFSQSQGLSELIRNYTDVMFRRDRETSLSGVQVSSNSTGMVHSEQMLPLGGKLTLVGEAQTGFTLKNTSKVAILDVGLYFRPDDGLRANETAAEGEDAGEPSPAAIEVAYVAKIEPDTSVPVRFTPLPTPAEEPQEGTSSSRSSRGSSYILPWLPDWDKTPIFAPEGSPVADANRGSVRLTRLARLATQRLRLLPGDVRLVGWTDDRLPGMAIRPEAPQNRTYTLVLAHLVRGALPPVKPDRNVAEDFLAPSYEFEAEGLDASEAADFYDPESATSSPSPQP